MFDALLWLQNHNPIYADIQIDGIRLSELPEDDVPQELLMVVRQEEDEEIAEKECESYVAAEFGSGTEDDMREVNEVDKGKLGFLSDEGAMLLILQLDVCRSWLCDSDAIYWG